MDEEEMLGSKVIVYICTVIILSLGAVGFAVTTAYFTSEKAALRPEIEQLLGMHRFLAVGECFAATDDSTGRTLPRVIDLRKVTEERLNACYSVSDMSKKACFHLQLDYLIWESLDTKGNAGKAGESDGEPPAPLRELQTRNWADCFINMKAKIVTSQYVLISDGASIRPGMMKIETMKLG